MKKLKILFAFATILAFAGPSCDKFSLNPDDLDITLDMSIIKTTITVQFLDAASGELVGFDDGKQVLINVFGPDSQWVVNTTGNRRNQFLSAAGYMTAGFDPYNAKPTPNDPVELTLVANLDGYVPTSLPISLISEGSHDFVVNMVNVEAPPEGVSVDRLADVGSTSDGRVNENIEINTAGNEVNIKLNEGTEIRDEAGQPLQGKLDVSVAYFNPTKAQALSCFPGGLSVQVSNESGTKESGAFFSAGFVAVDITDENGKQASTFGGGNMEMDLAVDGKIINYETGEPVQAGDRVPIWSYDDKTGEWAFEKYTYLTLAPDGLRATAHMQHLSYWNLDWLNVACAMVELYFTTQDPALAQQWAYNLWFKAILSASEENRTQGYFSGFPELTGTRTDLNTEVLQGVPLYREVIVSFYDQPGTTPLWNLPGPVTINISGNTAIEVPLTPNPNATGSGGTQTLTITFNVTIFCTDQGASAVIPDGTLLRYRKKGETTWGTITATGGTVTIAGLQQNQMYEVQALYDGEWVPTPVYEYFVESSSSTVLTKDLHFEIVCGG